MAIIDATEAFNARRNRQYQLQAENQQPVAADPEILDMISMAEYLNHHIRDKEHYAELDLQDSKDLLKTLKSVRHLASELNQSIQICVPFDNGEGFFHAYVGQNTAEYKLEKIYQDFLREQAAAHKKWLATPKGRRSQMHLVYS